MQWVDLQETTYTSVLTLNGNGQSSIWHQAITQSNADLLF